MYFYMVNPTICVKIASISVRMRQLEIIGDDIEKTKYIFMLGIVYDKASLHNRLHRAVLLQDA